MRFKLRGLARGWVELCFIGLVVVCSRTAAGLGPEQVLVVYNHFDADSQAIALHYQKARPGVEAFDLAGARIAGKHTITYLDYLRYIVGPLRGHMKKNEGMAERIVCIVLTKGIPHRIDDINHPTIGDFVPDTRAEWLRFGDYTAAAVDSELTLLWQDLLGGEKGGAYDSRADGFLLNPYYGSKEAIDSFSREHITKPKRIIDIAQTQIGQSISQAGWQAVSSADEAERIGPGDIYLVTRLDGPTREDVIASIDRAQEIEMTPQNVVVVLDANLNGELDKGDYRRAHNLLRRAGWNTIYDQTANFLTEGEIKEPIGAYASYGQNDNSRDEPEEIRYIRDYNFAAGAIFNTLESFNAKAFGGLEGPIDHPQTQLSDFIGGGGTLGLGSVWEPFSFSTPKNEHLLDAFLVRGMTFAEAAYSSLYVLSWQQIVVGDPLARIETAKP